MSPQIVTPHHRDTEYRQMMYRIGCESASAGINWCL